MVSPGEVSEVIDLSDPKHYKSSYNTQSSDNTLREQLLDAIMPRKSSRFVWKEGDGHGRKDDPNPKLYDEPPHKLVEGDESTYPPKFVDLSSMWVFQVVRCPFITQDDRYQRWPAVFPSKEPLRQTWVNKGLAPKVWSSEHNEWVYPVVFNKYQLHGDEGIEEYDIDQSEYVQTEGTNATHDILEGATCVIQEPPASSGGLASGGLQAAPTADEDSSESDEEEADEPPTKRQRLRSARKAESASNETTKPPMPAPKRQTGKRSKTKAVPLTTPATKAPATKAPATKAPATKASSAKAAAQPKPTPPKKKGAKKLDPTIKPEPDVAGAKIIDSTTGGKRFVVDESDSDGKQDDLLISLTALKEDKARCDEQLGQAQGKVVLLAAAVHEMWGLLGEYGERMAEWTAVVRRRAKGADADALNNLMDNLSDNKQVNDSLRKRANAIANEISSIFPGLDRVTQDDESFNAWRDSTPKHLEKLIEKLDQKVDGTGRFSYK